MRRVCGILILGGALLLTATLAHAQATLTGVARDTSGAVLPGVTVEASSPVLIQKIRTATTDGSGSTASRICSRAPTRWSTRCRDSSASAARRSKCRARA